jgi:hypothetical protein
MLNEKQPQQKNRTRPISLGRSMEKKVIPEKGKGKYDLDPNL